MSWAAALRQHARLAAMMVLDNTFMS